MSLNKYIYLCLVFFAGSLPWSIVHAEPCIRATYVDPMSSPYNNFLLYVRKFTNHCQTPVPAKFYFTKNGVGIPGTLFEGLFQPGESIEAYTPINAYATYFYEINESQALPLYRK